MTNATTDVLGLALATALLAGWGGPTVAAGPSDPGWPCVQRRVEHLSLGVMWPHPVSQEDADLPPELDGLAARLAVRRVSEDEARALVAAAAAANPDLGVEEYGRIFREAFERIDAQRAEIVAGLGRLAENQAGLAAEIRNLEAEMAGLEAAETPDFDRIDAAEAELDWRVRVFRDRNRSLTYVCESPVLLEQRAYAVAQMLLAAAG